MNIETTFTWERSRGEEIELIIGGEYTPAQVLNEYEGFVGEHISIEWITGPNGAHLNVALFHPNEIEAMENALLETARANLPTNAERAQFPGLRRLLDLPEYTPNKDFIC